MIHKRTWAAGFAGMTAILGLLWGTGCNVQGTGTSLSALKPSPGPPYAPYTGWLGWMQAAGTMTLSATGSNAPMNLTFSGLPAPTNGVFHYVPWILANGVYYNMAVNGSGNVVDEPLPSAMGSATASFNLPVSTASGSVFLLGIEPLANVSQPSGFFLMGGDVPWTLTSASFSQPWPVKGVIAAFPASYEIAHFDMPPVTWFVVPSGFPNAGEQLGGYAGADYYYVMWVTDSSGQMHNGGAFAYYSDSPLGAEEPYPYPVQGWEMSQHYYWPVGYGGPNQASISLAPGSMFSVTIESSNSIDASAPAGPVVATGTIAVNTTQKVPPLFFKKK